MLDDNVVHFAAVAFVFLGAGLVKGVIGMGLPTVAMGFLGLLMPLPQAASLLTIPAFTTNVWQSVLGPAGKQVATRFAPMQVGICGGVAVGGIAFPPTDDVVGRVVLGICLLAYGIAGLRGWRLRPPSARWEPGIGAAVGLATGVLTAITGVYVLPLVPYVQSLNLPRPALAQALGLSFTTSTVALGLLLAAHGHLNLQSTVASVLLLIPALSGMAVGQQLRDGMSDRMFRTCFFAGLAALGALDLLLGH